MTKPLKSQSASCGESSLIWTFWAVSFTILASLIEIYYLHGFYVEAESLAPGTEIRPMGLGAVMLLSELTSIILGGGCAIIGAILSLKRRRWRIALFAGFAIAAIWGSVSACNWEFNHIVTSRKLVLEE